MRRTNLRISSLYFGLLFFILVLLAASGVPDTVVATANQSNTFLHNASEQSLSSGVISASDSAVEWTVDPQPWSAARMEAAQPYPLPSVESHPITSEEIKQLSGNPTLIPGMPPTSSQPSIPSASEPLILSDQAIAGYAYPPPFTRFENFDSYTRYPYSAVGVLFFTQGSTDYRCSAAVVGENALWTAGHCLHYGSGEAGDWSENVVFVPAYKNGNEPFDQWTSYDLVTRVAWYSGEDFRFDIGGVILEPNAAEQSIQEVVGSLGFAYNLNPNQHWFNFGYPTDTPFDGKTMQICAGSFAKNATNYASPIPMGMGCDMTPGSSGGPWIINFSGSPGSANYVNGNNSFRYTGFGQELYSPYFGDAAKDLLDFISTDTGLRTNIHIPIVTSSGDE